MNRFILFFVPVLILAVFLLGRRPTQSIKEPESFLKASNKADIARPNLTNLKINKVAATKYQMKSLNNDIVELGTERHSPPKPFLKLHKWDEASLKVTIPYDVISEEPETIENGIRYSTTDNKQVEFVSRVPQEITEKDSNNNERKYVTNEDGGVEFNVILRDRPGSNVFKFPIETEGLDFFYQPPLNEEVKEPGTTCSETECKDKDGEIVNFRPEIVVGSYVAYYKDGKFGDYSRIGGKNFKSGKAFHIYRPLVFDSNGESIWGVLNVDQVKRELTVSIDKDWLTSASYPVTIDPTFGYTTIGASSVSISNVIRGPSYAISESGIPTSLSVYITAACFTQDTEITMADGSYKKIKDIKTGDKVLSYNEASKKIVPDRVIKIFRHTPEEMGSFYLVIETDNGRKIEVTPNHRIYLERKWVEAGSLKIGDKLLSDKNQETKIITISKVYERVPTYNLEIEQNHVYFANFLVHNVKPSFLTGTKITMADSTLKNIEDIKAGDKVLSYDLEKKEITASVVENTFSREHASYFKIIDIYGNALRVSEDHPILVNGKWMLAKQIEAGDKLFSRSGDVVVVYVKRISEIAEAFNFITSGHNYFADGKLVNDESLFSEHGDIASGSRVLTAKGYKKVEDLSIGEKIVTYNLETKKEEIGTIDSFQMAIKEEPVFLVNNSLMLTGDASIYTAKGEKKVKDLKIGDELIATGGLINVFSITNRPKQTEYAVSVSGNHNLFVNGFLVHNYTGYVKGAIYQQSDNTQVLTTEENTISTESTAWRTLNINRSLELTTSATYFLYAWGSQGTFTSMSIYYDSGGNGVNLAQTYGAWPNPLTGQTTDNNKYSIYATYFRPNSKIKGGAVIRGGTKLK